MRKLLLLALLFISFDATCSEIDDVLSALGVNEDQFDYIWSVACDSSWEQKTPVATLSNKNLLAYSAVQANLLMATTTGDTATLTAGPACKALLGYYFTGKSAARQIAGFLARDREFVSRFKVSALEAWGVQQYQSASMSGVVPPYSLEIWRHLEKRGLITITEKESTFNGAPSLTYWSNITAKGEALLQML